MNPLHDKIQFSPELQECAEGHYIAVVEEDEYRVEKLFEDDKEIEYIVDLGANLGTASMQFQKFFPEAKILVCEPEPELMKYAKLNTDNKLIYVEEAIIGDDRKEVTFNVCKWAGNGHVDGNFRWDLFEPMGSEKAYEIKVKASTLMEILDRYNFPRIDLLKIDTEGMEGQILQHFKPYMHLIKHIRGEWHGDKEIPIIRDALKDTHDIFFDRKQSTHGDVFATRKDFKPTEQKEEMEKKDGYTIVKRVGMPDKIIYD
jgi:FkbM family methyltransferase